MAKEAFYGIIGCIVLENDEFTESDPAAVLVQLYVLAGSCIGRSPHMFADATRHGTNLNCLVVGPTADGRKGTALSNAQQYVAPADPEWAKDCIRGGLSSGEGLVHAIRDQSSADLGVSDKRLCVVETEFSSVLKTMSRRGSTVSELVRQAFDSHTLNILTKNSPATCTNPHVSIVAHSTASDLRRHLEENDTSNGFLNRFLVCYSRRSKLLPESRSMPQEQFQSLTAGMAAAVTFAKRIGLLQRAEDAKRLWDERYEDLTSGHPGVYGSLTARGAAHCLRLSMVCAVLDRSHYIRSVHLEAALAIWNYCRDSIRFVFGDALGDRVADAILSALRANPAGLSRNDLFQFFKRNETSSRIELALKTLERLGLARCVPPAANSKGRTPEVWVATDPRGQR